MIKNLLLSLLGIVSTLAFNFDAQAQSLNYPDDSSGNLSVPTFNKFIDATALADYFGWGMELHNAESCVTGQLHMPSVFPAGYPYFEEKNTNCLGNAYKQHHGNENEALGAIDEHDFVRARICSGSNCNGTDTVRNYSGLESSNIKTSMNPGDCSNVHPFTRIQNTTQSGNQCYGTLKKTNFSSFQKYYNTLPTTLQSGDIVRVFTYIHNNASQGVAANAATNVNVNLSWNNGVVTSTITSPDAGTVTDSFNYNLPAGLTFKPKTNSSNQVQLYKNGNGDATAATTYLAGNSINIPMGTVLSSFGGMERLYVDFQVTAAPAPNLEITKHIEDLNGNIIANANTVLLADNTSVDTAKNSSATNFLQAQSFEAQTAQFSQTLDTQNSQIFIATDSNNAAPNTEMQTGTEFVYVLTPKNTGNTNSGAFTVTDTLPNEVEFISFLNVPTGITTSQSGQTVTFNVADLAAGADVKLKIKVKLKDETPNLTNFCNKAYLSQTGNDTIVSNNACLTATVEDPNIIIKKYQLEIPENPRVEMPNGTTLAPEAEFLYEVEIENNGPIATQSEVIVTDILDANIEWVNNNGDNNIVYEAATHKVTINFGIMPAETANRRSFKVKLKAGTPNGACHVKNAASFSYDDLNGNEFQSGTSNEVCVSVEDPAGFMKFEKWAKTAENAEWHKASEVSAGEVYEYRIMAFNNSAAAITNVVVTDPLNSNLTFDSSADTKVSHNGINPGGVVTIDFGDMPAQTGNIAHFKVKVADPIAAGTTIPNNIFDNKGYCDANGDGVIDADKLVDCGTVHTVSGVSNSDLSIAKSTQNLDGTALANNSTINNGTEFLYVLTTKNTGTETIEYVSITDTLPNEVEFVSFENIPGYIITTQTGQDVSFMIENFGAGKTYDLKIKVKLKDSVANSTKFCNTANLTSIEGHSESSNTICLNVDDGSNPTGKLEITKEAKTIADKSWHKNSPVDSEQDGGNDKNYLYKITVDNGFTTTQKGITVTDQLDSRIEFVDFVPYDTNDKDNTSSEGTSLLSGTNPINFLIGTIPANEFKHVVFKVKVITTEGNDKIPNVAKLLQDGKFIKDSNTTIHTVSDGNGGGGGGGSVDMTGICSYNNGSYACTQAYPAENPSDPIYKSYETCKKNAHGDTVAEDQCLADWVANKGFSSCDEDNFQESQCKPNIDIPVCIEEPGAITVSKKTTNGHYFSNGDTVKYEIKVSIDPTKFSRASISSPIRSINNEITNATINLHDIIVPSDSGFVWTDRESGIADIFVDGNPIDAKDLHKDGDLTKITYSLNPEDRQKLTSSEIVTKTFTYKLDTELVKDSNTCEITNVAFATVKVDYADSESQTSTFKNYSSGCLAADETTEDWLYTDKGSRVSADIKIVRPFIETKSGNLCADGSNKKTNGEKKTDCGELNNSIPTATIDKKIAKEIGKAATNTAPNNNKRLGEFSATDSNNGIYFLNNKKFEWKNQGKTLDLGRSETFIINGADLIISENLVSTSPDYIPAFIVKGGNIIIAPGVTKIDGVFIALEDEDGFGGSITSTGGEGMTVSKDQLVVSGNLIGDAKKLFISRRYIGNPNENGGTIEPSVKIVYDLRVFEQTPPGLNNFLGHNWKQEIE